jgi:hypothetical protein
MGAIKLLSFMFVIDVQADIWSQYAAYLFYLFIYIRNIRSVYI